MTRPLITLCLLAVHAAACSASDWPQWRGPLSTGVSPDADPPTKWSADVNVRWKTPLPGRGSSSPIVLGDKVFVLSAIQDREAKPEELPKVEAVGETKTSAPKSFYKFVVLALDRDTGKVLWERVAAEKVPHEGHHETHSYAAGSPATDGKRVYASFGSFGVFAFDLDGKQLWSRDLGRLRTRFGWGEAVTPAVHGDTVLLNWDQEADSKLIALNAATGETRWEADRAGEKTSWNTPLLVEHGGKIQAIVNGTERVRSYDLATGKVLWQVGGMTTNAIPSAVTADGVVYAMSGYRGAAAVAVPLDSVGDLGTDGKIGWRYGKGTPYVPSPLLYDGRLYFTQANVQLLTVLDAKSGKPLVQSERLPSVTSFYASPVGAAGRVYFTDRAGTTVVLKAGDKLEVLATNRLGEAVDASPALVGKQLFLRGEKHLYCIEDRGP